MSVQKHSTLREAREEIYAFFEDKGFVFPEGSKPFLSEAIKKYSAKHHEILIAQMKQLQEVIVRLNEKK